MAIGTPTTAYRKQKSPQQQIGFAQRQALFHASRVVVSLSGRRTQSSDLLPLDLQTALELVEADNQFRVLRRLPFPPVQSGTCLSEPLVGVIVDVETTGLDQDIHQVIELGMIAFEFDREGQIGSDFRVFRSFNEPSQPIPPEITRLTGITDDQVRGQRIDQAEVDAFTADAALVVAHNAAFDRPFVEALSPQFSSMAWACTATEIDWAAEGIAGGRLEYIAMAFGCFYEAHRATDDCNAVANILTFRLPRSDRSTLSALLDAARRAEIRIFAVGAPYDLRLPLKRAGYRWNDGTDGYPRAWWRDVEPEDVEGETAFLQKFGSDLVDPSMFRMNAKTRFRRGPSPRP
jgi:DNA polymerase-3 subunit epsilon